MESTTQTFTEARSTSRGRVHRAGEDFVRQIDELTRRTQDAVLRLEVEIGAIRARLDGFERRIAQESVARCAENSALRVELAETNRVAREALEIATRALHHAVNHAHRYNVNRDWRTARAYLCSAETPQWDI